MTPTCTAVVVSLRILPHIKWLDTIYQGVPLLPIVVVTLEICGRERPWPMAWHLPLG